MESIDILFGDYLSLACKLILAGVFFTAAIAKLFDLPGSRNSMKDFGVPDSLTGAAAIVLPVVELVIGVFLLSPNMIWYGALLALLLLITFTIGMAVQMARGNAPDCHCFGQLYSKPVGPMSIVRNIVLMLPAAVLLYRSERLDAARVHEWLNNTTNFDPSFRFMFLSAILAAACVIAFYLREILREQREANRRLSLVDSAQASGAHSHGHHEHNTSPEEGLPIGAPAPDFELVAINGKTVSFDQLLMNGRPMLFFFISPTCAPCKGMLPEIGKWQDELRGQVDFIFISTGSLEENAEKLPRLGGQVLLMQKKREVAEAFMAKWTPTALLVNAAGDIASRPAAGDTAISDLIELIKENPGDITFAENGRGMAPHKLLIGKQAAEFSLPEVNDAVVTQDAFTGKRTLVMFLGLDCSHCQRMLPDIKEWEDSNDGAYQLIVVSYGDLEQNRAMGLKSPLLIDEGNKIGNKLGMFGTPSAVLIDGNGVIVSETAVGAKQIWSLIGKRKLGEA